MVRKNIFWSIVAAITISVLPSSAHYADAVDYISIGTSGAGGTYAILGTAMAKVINKHAPGIQATIEGTPGGGLANVRLLTRKKIDFGIATSDNGYAAYMGEGPFKGEKNINVRQVIVGSDLPMHVVVPSDSPIKTVLELKGKTVAVTSAANGEIYVPQTLEVCGLKKEDYKILIMSTSEAIEAFKDERAAAIVTYAFLPISGLLDLTIGRRTIRFIDIPEDRRTALSNAYPYYSKGVIPAKSYPGQNQDIATTAITGVLLTHDQVDEVIVYKVTKAILENPGELAEVYKPASSFNSNRQTELFSGRKIIPPLHPGAEKYLREKGLIK